MLVLKRKEGQWIDITHKSGDTISIRVYNVGRDGPGKVQLAFDDADRNFEIQRPERVVPSTRTVPPVTVCSPE